LALILWQRSLCNKLQAFSGVLEEGVSTENIDIPLGRCNNRLHTATHHSAHHSAAKATTAKSALSTAEAAAAGSTLTTWEAAAAGSTLTAGEPTAARSTLTTKARSSALLTRLTLLDCNIGCLCLRCCVNGSKTSCDKRSKRDTSNYLLIHGNSPQNQQWDVFAATTWLRLPMIRLCIWIVNQS
jgi:hypothetical protein